MKDAVQPAAVQMEISVHSWNKLLFAVKCHNFVFKKVNRGFDQTQVWCTNAHALHLYHSHFLLPSQQINNTQYTQLILYTGAFFTFAHSVNESLNTNKLQTGCRITATLFQLQSTHNYTS
jgi:hypothetical protein